jgi:hypothetical protein
MQNQPTARATFNDSVQPIASSMLLVLRDIYLSVGLSPEAALRSARADYLCNFQTETSCAA